jgi:hypothetical protein
MQNLFPGDTDRGYSPWLLFLILGGYVLASLFLFNFLGLLLVLPFFDFSLQSVMDMISNPLQYEESKFALLIIQGVSAVGAFILTPIFVLAKYTTIPVREFFIIPRQVTVPLVLSVLVTFSFMVINAVIIEWNMNIEFTGALEDFGRWARAKEDQLAELTKHLTAFTGPGHFLLTLVIIAVIPGIGEELLFRGLLQNILNHGLKNAHMAIWITGFVFAAFHGQFFGLVPRMLLGVLFGYMYLWSGRLIFPMIAHFVNNGFMLFMIYFRDLGFIEYDIESTDNAPDLSVVLIFTILTAGILYLFYRIHKSNNNEQLAEGL